ncbi:dihydrolipoamide acetyltransferase family protein [Arthrobacter sp. FX8]|jgi:pyruvate dehydrogenase E2 component (dihydrolipoamide acetyltransferase)|uniref:dihydrolipoamide acetyltransferase family protein n=1 Tax=Micrococcaceae TaxID=1268 RepID=UPI000701FF8A|nr:MULTISPECIES: dihydrolipoamide acetyltransferase family protein [unclassified Arthrobacter]KRE67147.1 branched-chain alpha-keto acid dehydrogenase subunit E2 [Arthrobacter sp. Soil761]TWD50565.1 pyruvate dehydrogenase E2 component (dihydrolipoamide acetyltransferase) [Arthrobacter sp. AG367]WAJ32722.1 dihydrolipoamide acetyltransferase family protein [Arthrobacter sp. FX8]
MTLNKFNLPDVGEGLTEAEIVSWKVKPGDAVAINDVLCEIETAKSIVELPSPFAGTVTELLVGEGVTVDVGTAIISVSDHVSGDPTPADVRAPEAPVQPLYGKLPQDAAVDTTADGGAGGSAPAAGPLVGSGPKADAVKRRPRKTAPAAAVTVNAPQVEPVQPGTPAAVSATEPAAVDNRPTLGGTITGLVNRVLAKPPVRKIARDLGIDLADVVATGSRGEVTREDLVSYQSQRDAELDKADGFWGKAGKPQDQRVERIPVKGVRKATAKAMVESAFAAPHVSIFVDVDASRTMEFVKRLKASRDFEGIKVSPLLILAKAVIWAAARNPSVNASWVDNEDSDTAEIHVKHFMNLGIAAATPRGLMVPNIKNAQDLSLKELALALNNLATTARAGKTQPAEMQGGTLTITNIGALGIDTGTPIINPGEVAIVAFGTIKQKPWVLDGEVIPRWITTLGGSFDHRVVDGDLSARFMADVAAILEEPALLLD